MADTNTVPIIPPEIQELLSPKPADSPRGESSTNGEGSTQRGTEPNTEPAEPKVYKTHEDILADEEMVAKLFEDPRVQERVTKAAEVAAAKHVEADTLRRQQDEQVRAAKEDEDRLETLRTTNPTAYAQEMGRRKVSEKAAREQVEFATALTNDVTGKLTEYVRANFPKEAIDSLAGKQYPGSYGEAVTAYFDDLTKATRDHWRAGWEKDEMPAIRKRVLTELNGGEETIDAATRGSVASKDFATEEEMAIAFQNDKITYDEMRTWYRTHPVLHR